MARTGLLPLLAPPLLAACGWLGGREDARPSVGEASGTGTAGKVGSAAETAGNAANVVGGASVAGAGWIDPEPPEAQGRAEEVVGAPWSRDKTTQLTMSITTLDRRTTGLQGFQTGLAPAATSLEERLGRLGAEVTRTEVTIRLPGSVLFDFDSAQIRPDAERALLEVAEVVKGYAHRPVRIEGHTDAIASDAYNQTLSERRADTVRAWLAAHGAENVRLTARGYGESKPIADNATPEGRQKNRRVEVIIEKGG